MMQSARWRASFPKHKVVPACSVREYDYSVTLVQRHSEFRIAQTKLKNLEKQKIEFNRYRVHWSSPGVLLQGRPQPQ